MTRTMLPFAVLAVLAPCARGVAKANKNVQVIERIVAVINDSIILQSDLHDRIRPLTHDLDRVADKDLRKQRLAELKRQALDHMIGEKLISQEASKLKLEVTDKELERAIADVMSKNNLTRDQLAEALRREGKSIRAYKVSILRPQLLRMKVLNVAVRSRVSVSEKEIQAAYHKNMRDLGVETKVRARHIFVSVPDNATAKVVSEKERHAKELLAKILKNKASASFFADLARKYSDDSVTRTDGGDLGFFSRGTLPTNVESVVFEMKKGEVKGPLRTSRGFHLVQVTDRQESSARPYNEVKKQLQQQLYHERLEKSTEGWLRELRKRSHVVIKL